MVHTCIPDFRRQKQKDQEFKDSLDYIVSCLKRKEGGKRDLSIFISQTYSLVQHSLNYNVPGTTLKPLHFLSLLLFPSVHLGRLLLASLN